MEGHALQKEVNFSDTLIIDGRLCRIPGNKKGMLWSRINAHGWFSYEIAVRPNDSNCIVLDISGVEDVVDVSVTVGQEQFRLQGEGRQSYKIRYHEQLGNNRVRIRIDKISGHTPCVHSIMVV
jgi:hypothetical protein